MKKVLTLLIACLFAAAASALPARPGTFTVRQADGTVLTLQLMGDEHFHYYLDVTTGRKYQRSEDGAYTLLPEAQAVSYQSAGRLRRNAANEMRASRLAKWQQRAGVTTDVDQLRDATLRKKAVGQFSGALIGKRKGLVILVNFADLTHKLANPNKTWDEAFNKVGFRTAGAIGSVHDYFYDQSYGQFDLEFDVIGPVTVSHNMYYYGHNIIYPNGQSSDAAAGEMVEEACKLIDDAVDFKDYDWDGDGEVDQVYVIYAGYGEATQGADPNTIWPHEYWLSVNSGKKLHLDNVYIDTYACSSELRGANSSHGTTMNGIGAACHEFSHCIGYPDLYDTDYSGGFGMDAMSILDKGSYNGPSASGEVPCGYTAYERWMAGWLKPTVLDEGTFIENMKDIGSTPEAYVIYNGNKGQSWSPIDEYFLLENRKAERWFVYNGTYPGNHGLLVTHVDYDQRAWSFNAPNDDPRHQRLTIIPAGGSYGYNTGGGYSPTRADFESFTFPGSKKVNALTNTSHYSCGGKLFNRNTDGSYYMNRPITEIVEDTYAGTISFTFNGGYDNGDRWTVSLDAGSGTTATTTWTQTENREGFLLPEPTPNVEGARFVGWSPVSVSNATTRPEGLLEAGTKYIPTADVTLYAVYATSPDGPVYDEFKLAKDVVHGQSYVFATKSAKTSVDILAIDAMQLFVGSGDKEAAATVITVDFDGAVPTIVNPSTDIVWTATVDAAMGTFSLSNDGYYLLVSNNGIGLSAEEVPLTWSSSFGLAGSGANGSGYYYIHPSSGKLTATTRTTSTSRVFAYEKSDLSDKNIIYATQAATHFDGIGTVLREAPAAIRYDLQGRRSATSAHGITIEDGRRVIR